jgi:carboxylesterase type B
VENDRRKKIRSWTYIPPSLKELLTQRAKDEHNSESEIIEKALTMYLTKDVTDESLLIAKMTEIIRQLRYLDRKVDVGQKLQADWYQYFFLFSPELPHDEQERKARLRRAGERTQDFLSSFKRRISRMPALIEAIFGDMLEEEVLSDGEPSSGGI